MTSKLLKSHLHIHSTDAAEEEEPAITPEQTEKPVVITISTGESTVVDGTRILKQSEISVRLSLLGKTAQGDGYTYLKAVCTNMALEDITAIVNFKHLHFLDVSNNKLTLEKLQVVTRLPYLVLIQADSNQLNSAALRKMKYLQVIIMNRNNIETVEDVFQPELSTLEVGYNKIEKIYFKNRMSQIKCLDFRYNRIKNIDDLNYPNLDSLYLAGNKISGLAGIENLPNLRILHLRNNPIKKLDGFTENHTKLNYINLRNCKVFARKQIKKLKVLKSLDTLILKGCPYMGGAGIESPDVPEEEDDAELRVEVLATLPRVKRLNKTVVTPDERQEGLDLMKTWLEEGEKEDEEVEDEEVGEEQELTAPNEEE